jgi:hypothetical protein
MENQRYYVRHLPDDWPGKTLTQEYTIELVDGFGRATAWGYIGEEDRFLTIADIAIPPAVIDAARRQTSGCGDFVDSEGNQVLPKDLCPSSTQSISRNQGSQ